MSDTVGFAFLSGRLIGLIGGCLIGAKMIHDLYAGYIKKGYIEQNGDLFTITKIDADRLRIAEGD